MSIKTGPASLLITLLFVGIGLITWFTLPLLLPLAVLVPLALLVTFSITFHGRTLREWSVLRSEYRNRRYESLTALSTSGTALTWDGECAHMYVEISPRPLSTLRIKGVGEQALGLPRVPVDIVVDNLSQYDITLDHIAVIGHGYRTTTVGTDYEQVYDRDNSLGRYSRKRTVLDISLRLSSSLNSVLPRVGRDTAGEGTVRTVNVAAQRIMRALIDEGWSARVLGVDDLTSFDDEVRYVLGPAMEYEGWKEMGDETGVRIFSVRGGEVPHEDIPLEAETVTSLHIYTPRSDSLVEVDAYVAISSRDNRAFDVPRYFLDEDGTQGALASQMLPLTASLPVLRRATEVVRISDLGPGEQAFGLGVAVGESENRLERIFITTAGSYGSILYVAASISFLRTLLARLSVVGEIVELVFDDNGEDARAWLEWTHMFDSPFLRVVDEVSPAATVIVCLNEHKLHHRDNALTIVLVTKGGFPPTARNVLLPEGNGTYRMRTLEGPTRIKWTASADDRALVTGR